MLPTAIAISVSDLWRRGGFAPNTSTYPAKIAHRHSAHTRKCLLVTRRVSGNHNNLMARNKGGPSDARLCPPPTRTQLCARRATDWGDMAGDPPNTVCALAGGRAVYCL